MKTQNAIPKGVTKQHTKNLELFDAKIYHNEKLKGASLDKKLDSFNTKQYSRALDVIIKEQETKIKSLKKPY